MKKLALVIALTAIGCQSTQDNGVSNASYRQAIVKARDSLDRVQVDVAGIRSVDITHGQPWWDAHLGLLAEVATLLSDVLVGDKR